MSLDVEYAIKKDIRNNPVVREIDRQQKREFLRTMAFAAVIVGMLLFAAWPQLAIVRHGYDVERLRQELAAEQAYNRRLRLELEMRQTPRLIEERALGDLGMKVPSSRETVILERVPGAVPPRALVAGGR